MEKNKTGKYLKYGLGEIILVVMGILIALQINNWNEEKKSNKQIQSLLNNLVKSIEEDKAYLTQTEILQEFRSNSLSYVLKIAKHDLEQNSIINTPIPKHKNNNFWEGPYPDTLNMDLINRTIICSGVHDKVIINKNILDELKSTGLFSNIKNDSLKKSINKYYSFVNSNFLIDDWNKDLAISYRTFLRDNYGVLTMELYFKDNPLKFIQQNEPVQVRIYEMIGPARFRSNNASIAIDLGKDVIHEIEKY
ncbi:DUF6090 family protein [Winogradskyella ursingii]|uniref:DUF6090 family protein n=1 Tax=Winogradskyella ursingii TaxID=2686079 RepID=UPI0015C95498|nr:DUF6090 family protein [Winogradskyella ursingii]